MENMREYRMNFWRHKTNEANRGYFPTSLEIVKMEMDLIDFGEINDGSILNICDLTGGIGEQLNFMHEYIIGKNLVPNSYYNEVTKERYGIAQSKYGSIENFNLLNSDFFNLKARNSNNKKVFTIIRNNPPYGNFDYKGINVRMEDIFFIKNAEMQVDYGIQIFELPIHQLIEDKNLIRRIFYRYENVHIYSFPKPYFDKKQICVIGAKKKINTNDIELAEIWREKLINNSILSLDEVGTPIIKLNPKAITNTQPIVLYRDGKVTDQTLSRGFDAVFDSLVRETTLTNNDNSDLGLKTPLIEQLPGHIALDIYSGQYDGLVGDVLIKGGVKKGTKIIREQEKDVITTTEVEVVYPFVEITSSNGQTLIKEYSFSNDENETA